MGWGFWEEISAKSEEEIMEILEPYDLTGSLRRRSWQKQRCN